MLRRVKMTKKIILGSGSTLLAAILLLALFWYLANRNSPVQSNKDYVGSVACGECHEKEYASWAKTSHARVIRDVTEDKNPIIGEWGKTLTFQEGDLPEVTIRLEKSADDLHQVTLVDAADPTKESIFTVSRVSGGHGWKQRFYTKIDRDYYPLPLDWNETINDWVPFRLSFWWNSDGELKKRPLKIIAWGSMCAGCHETGVVTTLGFTGYQTSESVEPMIACEKCHGPGVAHTDDPEVDNIINPTDLAFEREVEVCGQCHGYGKSFPIGISRHPMKEFGGEMYRPGKVLAEYSKPAPIRWEGTRFAKKHRQQFFDHQQSAHYMEDVGCIGCHAPHGSEFEHNLKMAKDDNNLCLGCHAEDPQFYDAAAITKHTGHSPYLEGKDELTCISCHQQQSTFSASMGDGASHHFRIVSPAISLAMFDRFKDADPLPDYCSDEHIGHASLALCYSQNVIPNSCNGCHKDWKGSREGLEAGVKAFNEMFYQKKPGN
jgi:predicted CXXCH cytochrome family protein